MEIQTNLQNKRITPAGAIFLLVWSLLCLGIIWLLNTLPLQKPIVVQLHNPFPCEKTQNQWQQKDVFEVDQSVYICGQVKSSVTELDAQIQLRVYREKITSQVDAIFYDNIGISNGDISIPINTYLVPGNYVVQISKGKTTLSTVTFEVID